MCRQKEILPRIFMICEDILAVYDGNHVSHKAVYSWFEKLAQGT
jgi:hypothetical protein